MNQSVNESINPLFTYRLQQTGISIELCLGKYGLNVVKLNLCKFKQGGSKTFQIRH